MAVSNRSLLLILKKKSFYLVLAFKRLRSVKEKRIYCVQKLYSELKKDPRELHILIETMQLSDKGYFFLLSLCQNVSCRFLRSVYF